MDRSTGRDSIFQNAGYFNEYSPNKDFLLSRMKTGYVDFKKQKKREANTNLKPYQIPSFYDNKQLEKGWMVSSDYKKPKGVVSLDKQSPRNNVIYNFDKDVMKDVNKFLKKKDNNMSDYLPVVGNIHSSSRNSQNVRGSKKYTQVTNKNNGIQMVKYIGDDVQNINGSFLCYDDSNKKLIDITIPVKTIRQIVTGEKSTHNIFKTNRI